MNESSPVSLGEIPLGSDFRVERLLVADQDGLRLKRLGICEGRIVRLVQSGDPMIIEVVGCRIGISRRLANHVLGRAMCITSDQPGRP